jgi:hypothetical protein
MILIHRQQTSSPTLGFCRTESSLDGCDSMLHDNWLGIPCVDVFASNLEWLVKNTRRNIFTIIFLRSFHKGITAEGENSYIPKSAYFRTKACPWKIFELRF